MVFRCFQFVNHKVSTVKCTVRCTVRVRIAGHRIADTSVLRCVPLICRQRTLTDLEMPITLRNRYFAGTEVSPANFPQPIDLEKEIQRSVVVQPATWDSCEGQGQRLNCPTASQEFRGQGSGSLCACTGVGWRTWNHLSAAEMSDRLSAIFSENTVALSKNRSPAGPA